MHACENNSGLGLLGRVELGWVVGSKHSIFSVNHFLSQFWDLFTEFLGVKFTIFFIKRIRGIKRHVIKDNI